MLDEGLKEIWREILLRLEQKGNSCRPKSGATRNKRILEDFRMKYNRNDAAKNAKGEACLLYTSPGGGSPRQKSRPGQWPAGTPWPCPRGPHRAAPRSTSYRPARPAARWRARRISAEKDVYKRQE